MIPKVLLKSGEDRRDAEQAQWIMGEIPESKLPYAGPTSI